MYQRTTLPPLPQAADLRDAWNAPLPDNWLEILGRAFRLPQTFRGFMAFSMLLISVAAGVTLQLLLSIQTSALQSELIQLERQLSRIERDNSEIVWRIAQNTSLPDVVLRARRLGFTPVGDAIYFVQQSGSQNAAASVVRAEPPVLSANSAGSNTSEQGFGESSNRLFAPFIDTVNNTVSNGDLRWLPEETQIRNLRQNFTRGMEAIGERLSSWSDALIGQLPGRSSDIRATNE